MIAMGSRWWAWALATVACATAAQASPNRTRPPEASDDGSPPPRLIVTVTVDQLIPEQLERLRPWLHGGFGRFVERGLVFEEAALRHARTDTGPGHATLGTACDPSRHGIVGNDWLRPDGEGTVYCVEDPDALPVTSAGALSTGPYASYRLSARNLRVPGVADFVRDAVPGARTVTISCKDRAAILQAGRHPELALWWDRVRGGFLSSTWYVERLPDWVDAWNGTWLERLRATSVGEGWHSMLPDDFASSGTAPDDREGESPFDGTRTFPHPFPPVSDPPSDGELAMLSSLVYGSPAGDELVLAMAREAVDAMELGADDRVDLLQVSLSSCDTVGHAFGPYSHEVTDLLLRTDRALGDFFSHLDERVGANRWIAALTSDHGVLPLPEHLATQGVEAHRLTPEDFQELVWIALERVEEEYGQDFCVTHSLAGVLLDGSAMEEAGVDPRAVRETLATALVETSPFVEAAWTRDALDATARDGEAAPGDRLVQARSFDEERSPDVTIQLRPNLLVGMPLGTSHGSPYAYDRRVPLVFLGPGFPAERRSGDAASIDAVPTLLHRAGVPVPEGLDGRVLE